MLIASNVEQLRFYSYRCNAVVKQLPNGIETNADRSGKTVALLTRGKIVDRNGKNGRLLNGVLGNDNVSDVTTADHVDPKAEMITSSGGGIARASVQELICEQGDDTLRGARAPLHQPYGKGDSFIRMGY